MVNHSVLLISLFCAGIAAWVISRTGERYKLVDYPSARSSHTQPVPKGGGVGIVIGIIFASLWLRLGALLWLPAVIIGLLGLMADRIEIAPRIRLFSQLALALLFLLNFPARSQGMTNSIILVFLLAVYIAGTANIYNFMDGINGLAAITGIIGFSLLGSFALANGFPAGLASLLFAIAAACLGFLPFNFPKARVFMGDIGSTSLGFLFACMAAYLSGSLNDFLCIIAFMFPFYADELVTMSGRIVDHEDLTQAHRRHLYQIIVNEGQVAHWPVSLGYGAAQLGIALIAWRVRPYGALPMIILLATLFCGFAVVSALVRKKICSQPGDGGS